MKKEKPDLSVELIDLHKTLHIIYHKGYLAGLKEAKEIIKDKKDEKKTNI